MKHVLPLQKLTVDKKLTNPGFLEKKSSTKPCAEVKHNVSAHVSLQSSFISMWSSCKIRICHLSLGRQREHRLGLLFLLAEVRLFLLSSGSDYYLFPSFNSHPPTHCEKDKTHARRTQGYIPTFNRVPAHLWGPLINFTSDCFLVVFSFW